MLLKSKSALVIGTAISLLAVHGRWDLAVSAWIFSIFLLRFTRQNRPLAGLAGAWLASATASVFYLYESGLPVLSPMLVVCLAFGVVLVLPYLLDRLLAPRLGPLARTLVFPAGVVAAEFSLGAISPLGTALSSLGTTQHENLPLIQVAGVTGTYGVSFLVAWLAPVANHVWERREGFKPVLAFTAVLVAVLLGGTVRLAFFAPDASTVRVAGISPSQAAYDAADDLLAPYDEQIRLLPDVRTSWSRTTYWPRPSGRRVRARS